MNEKKLKDLEKKLKTEVGEEYGYEFYGETEDAYLFFGLLSPYATPSKACIAINKRTGKIGYSALEFSEAIENSR